MTAPLLQVDDVHTYYGRSQALFGVSMVVGRGECVTLLGRNGMGRSTTVKSIMGMQAPAQGSIRFLGRDVTRLSSHQVARMGIGLVPEGRRVFATLTVEENLLATSRSTAAPGLAPWTLPRIYEMFPRLQERTRQVARTLSGGEQQMLAIGRALMTNPQLMILDEATEGLAPIICDEIWATLTKLKGAGLSMIVIDKNIASLLAFADHHYILEKGSVAWEGDTASFVGAEASLQPYLGI